MLNLGTLITAMVTPFNGAGNVDFDEAIRIARYLLENGTDTVLLSGTTGESPTLTHDEEFELYRRVITALPKAAVMVGTGSNCTRTAIKSTQEAERLGASASLQVVPYYNKPSQEGLYQHFKAIAENTKLPILLYNIPGRTGINMLPQTVARLAHIPNIIGIKEAAGSVEQMAEIRALTSPEFEIYSGDDALTIPFMEKGAKGVVSVASHVAGPQIKAMITAFTSGDTQKANAISAELDPLFHVLFITSNPVPVKAAMTLLGFKVGSPRLPLVAATPEEIEQVRSVMKQLSLI